MDASNGSQRTFDVRSFARTAQGSLRAELDFAAIAHEQIEPRAVQTLATLARLEGATMAHLRNVLVTATHKDARVTAFLVTWAYEKYWIADALDLIVDAVRDAHPVAESPHSTGDGMPTLGSSHELVAAASGPGPVQRALAGFTQGWDIVGAHLTVGLVDDWVLGAAYRRVAATTENDDLSVALRRLLDVKSRHTEFFASESRRRLSQSRRAERLASRELGHSPVPLGAAAIAEYERRAFLRFVFGDRSGADAASALRLRMAALPGLATAADRMHERLTSDARTA